MRKEGPVLFIIVLLVSLVSAAADQDLFNEGLDDVIRGKTDAGLLKLRTVYLKYPRSRFAEKARYYAGYYAPDIFQQAVEFKDFCEQYPNSKLKEGVYYQLGMNFYYLKNFTEAQAYFEKYLWEFPGGIFADSVNFYLGIIAREKGESDLFVSKLSGILNYTDTPFYLIGSFMLFRYFRDMGITERAEKYRNNIGDFSPPLKFNSGASECWEIQLGAFSKAEGALSVKKDLEKKGYENAEIIKVDNLYKVLWGEFKTREDAEKTLVKMKKKGYEGRIIVKDR